MFSDEMFEQLSLFQGLTPQQRSLITPLFVPCDHNPDVLLFAQGDPAEYLYVVVSGEVVVNFKPDDGPPITVARVRDGGVVGWSAALGSRTYTSAGMCSEFTQLLRVSGADLRTLCQHHPDTGLIILNRLAAITVQRLNNTHEQVLALLEIGLRTQAQSTGD
jgi:CRP/FNR family transcriptional regulator, cyclic AMP receptor protein